MKNLKKEAKVHGIFEAISGKYDMMNNIISFFRHSSWRRNVIKKVGIEKGSSVLDLCCGTGEWTLDLAREVGPQRTVYGIDFSKCMLNRGRDKLLTHGLDQAKLIYGNITSLLFSDNSFDYATLGFGLRNVAGTKDALAEIQRVIKPGGKLACLETSKPSSPLFRYLCYLYMRYLIPVLGFVFARRFKEYRWLQESTWNFPKNDELVDIFHKEGFTDISVAEFLYGAVTMYLMIKK